MLKYNVWIYNINRRKMEVFNVFEHYSFLKGIKNILLEKNFLCSSIEDFSSQLKKEVLYYFWSRAEWEIVIQPWCNCHDIEKAAEKIDICDQLIINWDIFVKYIWDNKQEVINYE